MAPHASDPSSFRDATDVQPVPDRVAGIAVGATATYSATVHDGWDIFGNANGGYLAALVARAAEHWSGRPPLSVTTHFLVPGAAGPATVELQAERVGRRYGTVRGALVQNDRKVIEVLMMVGASDPGGFVHSTLTPPVLPGFDDPAVIPTQAELDVSPAIFSRVDARLEPASGGFRTGNPSGVAESVGWMSLGDEAIDEVALLLVADAFPPPLFNLDGPAGWVPTLELTVHVRARPAPGPLRCRFVSEYIADGLVGEDGEVWDAEDRLVCQSRQLALVPRG